MQDTAKYLIHADIAADGVVERSDVVGAVFGQTEGLLGDELDLRHLQDSSKVGRIDVDVDSENGQSFGSITIASSLDQVETAILAAALETIDRVGPCRARVSVKNIEDVRAAKRREVVERAKELLTDAFEGSYLTSEELIEEVRRTIRVEDVTEYEGLPAGPRVADSDAIIVVEGRADVLTLLRYGIKNAIAVEGTNVPDAVAELTDERTVTAFLDGDRGGELILEELSQVGDVDYVAFAPEGQSVEDLSRHEVMAALREKVAYDAVSDAESPLEHASDGETVAPPEAANEQVNGANERASPDTDTDTEPAPASVSGVKDENEDDAMPAESEPTGPPASGGTTAVQAERAEPAVERVESEPQAAEAAGTAAEATAEPATETETEPDAATTDEDQTTEDSEPETLRGHVNAIIGESAGTARLLDAAFETLTEVPVADAFDAIEDAEPAPTTVVVDDELSQRVLDVAAQRGVGQIVCRTEGEFVKRPASVRVRTADQL